MAFLQFLVDYWQLVFCNMVYMQPALGTKLLTCQLLMQCQALDHAQFEFGIRSDWSTLYLEDDDIPQINFGHTVSP